MRCEIGPSRHYNRKATDIAAKRTVFAIGIPSSGSIEILILWSHNFIENCWEMSLNIRDTCVTPVDRKRRLCHSFLWTISVWLRFRQSAVNGHYNCSIMYTTRTKEQRSLNKGIFNNLPLPLCENIRQGFNFNDCNATFNTLKNASRKIREQ